LFGLENLMLYDIRITDAGLQNLKGLTNLRQLTIGHTGITDSGLQDLEGLNKLEELYLFEPKVTDSGLMHLIGLTNLRRLVLARGSLRRLIHSTDSFGSAFLDSNACSSVSKRPMRKTATWNPLAKPITEKGPSVWLGARPSARFRVKPRP
jgi:hypothetical protein